MRAELAAVRPAVDQAVARVLDSGVFIGGPEVEGLERELAAALGVRHVVGVSSGTDALLVVAMALGWGPGDEVVTTPLSFFATVGAILRLGARPVFADVDERLLLDPQAAAAAVTPHTRAVLPVHLFGLRASPAPVAVPIVEDAAQAIGSGPPRGLAATLSFFPTKNLGALGDGGAVLTDDDALAARLALLRRHGAEARYHHVAVGGNFRLDALQAAVLRAKLPHLAAWTEARRAHAARYRRLFASAGLAGAELTLPPDEPGHVYHQFVVRAAARDRLRAHLTAAGIGSEVYYPSPLHLQPVLAALGYRAGACPRAEAACSDVLALPIHPALTDGAIEQVVAAVKAFYR
ncbi:MAG TPA: DegT/DnrJ/EryC1/StrS family aminotransferase [Kofleriaceae bacterium]|nr:DegT/DnrJ/EryC1/StrS family aminotransferase [Kofleriaceae bacterium]